MGEAKFRPKTYHRKDPKHLQSPPCWYRVYVNGYGGEESLDGKSYEGAVGGYLFVCPSTVRNIIRDMLLMSNFQLHCASSSSM